MSVCMFITAKIKKSDNQTNIDKCRVAANITEYLYSKIHDDAAIISSKKFMY